MPNYFKNYEVPIICYKYNKPIRGAILNFNKLVHWLGAYRTYALYSGHIFVRFNDLEEVFTRIVLSFWDILLFGFKPIGKSVLLICVFIMAIFGDGWILLSRL